MIPSFVGKLAGGIFFLLSGLLAVSALVAFFTWGLNSLEISSILSRWFGAGAWHPFLALVVCSLGSWLMTRLASSLYETAMMVAAQEKHSSHE